MVPKPAPSLRFANAVRALRKARSWSQRALAEKSGVDRIVVKRIEAGGHNATSESMLRICAALGEPFERVFWPERAAA